MTPTHPYFPVATANGQSRPFGKNFCRFRNAHAHAIFLFSPCLRSARWGQVKIEVGQEITIVNATLGHIYLPQRDAKVSSLETEEL